MHTIGARLKEEREGAGLSQAEVMEVTGVTRKTLFNYESGERSPDAEFLAKVHAAGFDTQYVLTGVRLRPMGIEIEDVRRTAETAYQMVQAGGLAVSGQQFAQMMVALLNAPQAAANAAPAGSATTIHGQVGKHAQVITGNGNIQTGMRQQKTPKKTQ
ncbi:XRE family transcriptional regulator [Herbaspirillum lusitanum]|uniref:helix-turn-helix domain-containing protein n=1 Tax=Herbaspirillum lusitanum TaxID=213312 RepID=UPI0022388FDD|nr:helix-turn-helix transcriptional regulator [Herbaspirillum lusitanum]MCW5300890.1 XRE family transcriptional regulator [Herbaspirillum lusitanum]